jgi:hypothetical protein
MRYGPITEYNSISVHSAVEAYNFHLTVTLQIKFKAPIKKLDKKNSTPYLVRKYLTDLMEAMKTKNTKIPEILSNRTDSDFYRSLKFRNRTEAP